MPSFNRSKSMKKVSSNKSKSVSEMIDEIGLDNETLFSFSDEELDGMIAEMQTTSSARSPEEIDRINTAKFESAMKTMQFASVSSDKAILSVDEVKEKDVVNEPEQELVKLGIRSALVFAFVHGNVTSKKCWMRVSHSDKDKSKFVSFPLLNAVGSRSVLVHVFREEISSLLKKGKKNTLVTVLERSNIKIKQDRIRYLFPKGHLLAESRDDIIKIRNDLSHIFNEMQKPVEKRVFSLKYFA